MAANYAHHDPQSPKFSDGIQGYKELVVHYLTPFLMLTSQSTKKFKKAMSL